MKQYLTVDDQTADDMLQLRFEAKIGALFRRAAKAEPERTTYRNAWAATVQDWFPEILVVGTGRGYHNGTWSYLLLLHIPDSDRFFRTNNHLLPPEFL